MARHFESVSKYSSLIEMVAVSGISVCVLVEAELYSVLFMVRLALRISRNYIYTQSHGDGRNASLKTGDEDDMAIETGSLFLLHRTQRKRAGS